MQQLLALTMFQTLLPCLLTDWMGEFTIQVEGENTGNPSDLTLDDFTYEGCGLPVSSGECPLNHIKCPNTG